MNEKMDGQKELTVNDETSLTPMEKARGEIGDMMLKELERWEDAHLKITLDQYMIAYRLLSLEATYPDPQPFHPDDYERRCVKNLREMGMSMAQIAFVFDRSTATILSIIIHGEITKGRVGGYSIK